MYFISGILAYLFSYNTVKVGFGWAIDGEYASKRCMKSFCLSICFCMKGVTRSLYVNSEVKITLREHIFHCYHPCSCQWSVQKFRRHFCSQVSLNALYGCWWRMFGVWKLRYVSTAHQALVSPKTKKSWCDIPWQMELWKTMKTHLLKPVLNQL